MKELEIEELVFLRPVGQAPEGSRQDDAAVAAEGSTAKAKELIATKESLKKEASVLRLLSKLLQVSNQLTSESILRSKNEALNVKSLMSLHPRVRVLNAIKEWLEGARLEPGEHEACPPRDVGGALQGDALFRQLFSLLRRGEIDAVLQTSRHLRQGWIELVVIGGRYFDDPSADDAAFDRDSATSRPETTGNPRRKQWKEQVKTYSEIPSKTPYERAFFGMLAGNVGPVARVVTGSPWSDNLWAHVCCSVDSSIEVFLDSAELGFDDINAVVASKAPLEITALYQWFMGITNEFIGQGEEGVAWGALLCDSRLACHLSLLLGSPCLALVKEFTLRLSSLGQGEAIPEYVKQLAEFTDQVDCLSDLLLGGYPGIETRPLEGLDAYQEGCVQACRKAIQGGRPLEFLFLLLELFRTGSRERDALICHLARRCLLCGETGLAERVFQGYALSSSREVYLLGLIVKAEGVNQELVAMHNERVDGLDLLETEKENGAGLAAGGTEASMPDTEPTNQHAEWQVKATSMLARYFSMTEELKRHLPSLLGGGSEQEPGDEDPVFVPRGVAHEERRMIVGNYLQVLKVQQVFMHCLKDKLGKIKR